MSLEGLRKDLIKVHNNEKQICFNDKKRNKV